MTQGTSFNYLPETNDTPRFLRISHKIGFLGIGLDNKDDLSKWRAYWLLAPHAIFALLLGWLTVFLSAVLGIRPASSGAMLVGAAILAQFFHSRWLYRALLEVKVKEFQFAAVSRVFHLNPRALISLSLPSDHYPEPRQHDEVAGYDSNWLYPRTVNRIDQQLEFVILLCVVIGTVLWGYGDLILPCRKLCN